MSKRFIPVLVVLIIGGLFVAYGVLGKNESSLKDPNDKYEQILRNVGIVLEQGHYSPKKIDDKFSAEVLKNLEETLDPDKSIFYQKDIKSFTQYETQIDNEIHGAPLKSFYFIVDVYRKRFDELEALYNRALAEPMNFNIKESYQPDPEKRDYPANEKERYDFVRKKMKYQVLVKYSDLMDLRDSSKVTPRKADSTLLREAKETVSKQINRLFQTTKSHYSTDDLFSTFVNAITGTMDPHTTFMNPVDKRSFDESLSGTFYGIGAQLQEVDGQIRIASIITGMPAWKNGELEVNDVILKVGQGAQPPVDVTSYSVQDAVKLIRGEKLGSEVRLTVKKTDGTVKVISLLRDKIDLEDTYARSAIIEGTNKIGFIRLPEFYADFENPSARRSSTDVAKEVKKLMDQHVDGIIIDLRQNGGGSLQDVVDMVGLFVKDGPVVQVKGRNERANVLNTTERGPLYSGPLAVMVDELSASASEIFAAAIQDYHRGIIIGSSSTFGKGTVQRAIPLNPQYENVFFSRQKEDLGNIKLTFRKFYRINGGATQLKGVVPDIIVPDRLEKMKIREKDNPDALGWDTISRVKYTLWNPGYNYSDIVSRVEEQISKNPNFEGIKKTVDEIDQFTSNAVPLNMVDFKKQQAQGRALSKQLDNYYKAPSKLDVVALPEDLKNLGSDSLKINTQNAFLKGVSNDIYVGEAVSIIKQMVSKEQLVKREGKKELSPAEAN